MGPSKIRSQGFGYIRPPPQSSRPSIFIRVLGFITFIGNVCGHGPVSFPAVLAACFGGSYLIRAVQPDFTRPGLLGSLILLAYYFIVAGYRVLIYNRFLDPLLAIPGPDVLTLPNGN